MKGFFVLGHPVIAGCKQKVAGCTQKVAGCTLAGFLLMAVTLISCATAPPTFRVEVPEVIVEQEYSGETTVSVDFYNDSQKTVIALEIAVPAAEGYLMKQVVECAIPPGGSTRLTLVFDEEPEEPVAAAVTEIRYEDGSRFFDPVGRESGLWW